ncbi:MAG: YitT family protein [Eubacteriales bacterium]|nr:YitT family protein [Eubacteriales bacterium]
MGQAEHRSAAPQPVRGRRKGAMALEKHERRAVDLLCDGIGGVAYALGLETFAKAGDFAPGGVSGLALLVEQLCGLPVGLTVLALNVPLLLLGYRCIGRAFLCRTVRSMVVCTVLLDVVFPHVPVYTGDRLLAALYAGALLGAGLALFYRRGSSSGGIDLLVLAIRARRPQLSIGVLTLLLDVVVVLLGWPVFGDVDAVLYGLVAAAVTSLVIDRLLCGVGGHKLVMVITGAGQAVAAQIAARCGCGATLLHATGVYTGAARHVLLCACAKTEVYRVRATIDAVDPAAFVLVADMSGVFGTGFGDPTRNDPFP